MAKISDEEYSIEGLMLQVQHLVWVSGLQDTHSLTALVTPAQKHFSELTAAGLPRNWIVKGTSRPSLDTHLRALIVRDMVLAGVQPGETSYDPHRMDAGALRIISKTPDFMYRYIQRMYAEHRGMRAHSVDTPCFLGVEEYKTARKLNLSLHPFNDYEYQSDPKHLGFSMGALAAEVELAEADSIQLLLFVVGAMPEKWALK